MLLISILAVGTVSLAIVLGSAVALIGELHTGAGDIESREALAAAESCIQESLLGLIRDMAHSGTTLVISDATCTSTVTSQGDTRRMIVATGIHNRSTRTVTLRADIVRPKPIILEWKEW